MKRFALTWRPDMSVLGVLESEEQPIWNQLVSLILGMSRFWLEKAETSFRLSWIDLESMNISNIFLFQGLETAAKWLNSGLHLTKYIHTVKASSFITSKHHKSHNTNWKYKPLLYQYLIFIHWLVPHRLPLSQSAPQPCSTAVASAT